MLRVVSSFVYAGSAYAVYRAERAGDELPMHDHPFEHICVPMTGEIEAFFDDRDPVTAKPGDQPFEFLPRRKHGIRARTDGATFMNIARV